MFSEFFFSRLNINLKMDLDDIVLDDYDFNIELPSEGAPSNVPSTSLETMPIETTESATQKEKLKKKKFDENL